MESPVACSLCDFRSPSLSLWLSHLRHVHRSDTAITIKCPVGDCGAVYDKVNSFCSHMYRSHRVLCTTDTDASANNKQTTASPSSIVHPMSIETGTEVSDDLQHDIDQLLETDGFEQRKKSSLYLLQIKEERMVSQAAVNDIVQGCQEVFQHTIGRIKAGVKRKLSSSGIDPTEVSGLDELFTSVTEESFSFALKFCRTCMATSDLSQTYFNESSFQLRTPAEHSRQCFELDGPDRVKHSVEYGINQRAALEELPYFSVVHGLPHDVMHDLMEGVIPHEMRLLLNSCISDGFFDVSTFNHRLNAFDFGYTESGDKPAAIEDGVKIRQSAAQMWLLARILPFLVGDLIPRDYPQWECFLKLLQICDICTAPSVLPDTAMYLELLIEEHHTQFSVLYGKNLIIPKMHLMVHYPGQSFRFGPLIQAWTMRHEAKLRIIKRAARASNYKNVCQTAEKRHQHLLCYYLHTNKLLQQSVEIGPCKSPNSIVEESPEIFSLMQTFGSSNDCMMVSHPAFVKCNGNFIKRNVFILTSFDVLDPVFCKVIDILSSGCGIFLVIRVCHYLL